MMVLNSGHLYQLDMQPPNILHTSVSSLSTSYHRFGYHLGSIMKLPSDTHASQSYHICLNVLVQLYFRMVR
jgi:hypothetical protein